MTRKQVLCQCGCGETCGNMFKQGHDQRHKMNLIRQVIDFGNSDAYEELKQRNWLMFLEKSQVAASPIRQQELAEEKAQETNRRINDLKAAAAKVKEAGRNDGIDRIEVTHENVQAILEEDVEMLKEWPPSRGDWKIGDEAILERFGERHRIKIEKIYGARFLVSWTQAVPGTSKATERRTTSVNIGQLEALELENAC